VRSRSLLRAVEAVRRRNHHAMPRTGDWIHRAITAGLPDQVDVELLPGIDVELDLRQDVERRSWWQGARFEHPTTVLFDAWAAAASHTFDVGANYGFFALRAVQAGCPEVHAFEPHPDLHRRLATTAQRNGLDGLHAHHLGLSDEPQRLALNIRDTALGHGSFGPREWADGRTTDVDVASFDDWRRERGIELPAVPSWVLKVDVEGYEHRVLRGMPEALAARAFLGVVVELNELTLQSCATSSGEVLDVLREAGYVEVDEQPAVDGMRNAFLVPRSSSPEPRP
jgi:FkbM family methyltransferase